MIIADLKYQEDWIKSHPDRPSQNGGPAIIYKPPFAGGGDYFSSLVEWPDHLQSATNPDPKEFFRVSRTVSGPKGTWNVHVRFWYDSNLMAWEDVVVVVEQRGSYVIDDVLYSGATPFNGSGRLSVRLKARY